MHDLWLAFTPEGVPGSSLAPNMRQTRQQAITYLLELEALTAQTSLIRVRQLNVRTHINQRNPNTV